MADPDEQFQLMDERLEFFPPEPSALDEDLDDFAEPPQDDIGLRPSLYYLEHWFTRKCHSDHVNSSGSSVDYLSPANSRAFKRYLKKMFRTSPNYVALCVHLRWEAGTPAAATEQRTVLWKGRLYFWERAVVREVLDELHWAEVFQENIESLVRARGLLAELHEDAELVYTRGVNLLECVMSIQMEGCKKMLGLDDDVLLGLRTVARDAKQIIEKAHTFLVDIISTREAGNQGLPSDIMGWCDEFRVHLGDAQKLALRGFSQEEPGVA